MNAKKISGLFPVSVIVLVLAVVLAIPAYAAHPDHKNDVHQEEVSGVERERLEKMVAILQQLVVLLTEYKKMYGTYSPSQPAHTEPDEDTHTPAVTEKHEEGDEHSKDEHEEASTTTAKLVIEIEPHMGKTHVHMRYTDKPEEMFFVDVAITDEDSIVSAISQKTGMHADVVRPALKYMQ
jgi:predicted DsbA family dithiol-disulfide isomerase